MARRPGAAQAQDSDSQLVKSTLALLAALRREHREPTEPRTGKPPPRGESRAIDAPWWVRRWLVLGVDLNVIPAGRQIAQGERGLRRSAQVARAARGVYFLGQLVAGLAGAEEQEPVRHGVPASVRYQLRAILTGSAQVRPASGTAPPRISGLYFPNDLHCSRSGRLEGW